jgi:hypothetical protein
MFLWNTKKYFADHNRGGNIMKYLRKMQIALVWVFPVATAMILGSTSILYAASELPYTFSPGQTISSAQVNANFQALSAQIAALQAQLAPVSIVGTYDFFTFGTGMSAFPPGNNVYGVSRNSYRGTLVFGAGGTVAINGTGEYTSMQLDNITHQTWSVSTNTDPDIDTQPYTVSGSTVTMANGVAVGTLSADGKILILKYNSSNTTGITIGIRR